MNILNVIIERTENNYSAYIREVDGITAVGNSLTDIKNKIRDAIKVYLECCDEYSEAIPQVLQEEYELSFNLDAQSFLNIYAGILSKSGLEKLTGINQKQLWHYANGHSTPRKRQREKIESALHNLGEELISLHL